MWKKKKQLHETSTKVHEYIRNTSDVDSKSTSLRRQQPNCQDCMLLPKLKHIASGPELDYMTPAQASSVATAHLCAM